MNSIRFISKKQVILLHKLVIDKYGGFHGIRDHDLLDSAIEMPKSGFGNEYFHKSIFDKASAYLYHLVKNHAFIDGNKRIGFACTDVFLLSNGYNLKKEKEIEIYELILAISSGEEISKEKISIFLENYSFKKLV